MVREDRKRRSVELRANAEGGGASCEKVKGSACQNGARMVEMHGHGEEPPHGAERTRNIVRGNSGGIV